MSMLGVRDMSVIETPPKNRLSVQTYVVEHRRGARLATPWKRELARDGQVYYLYNRVQGLQQNVQTRFCALVPEARIAVCAWADA